MRSGADAKRAPHVVRPAGPDPVKEQAPSPARALLALQRTAGNAAVGAVLRRGRATRSGVRATPGSGTGMRTADRLLADAVSARGIARCPGPACGCGKPADEFEEFPHLDGKSLDPEAPIEEELEGHGTRVLARSAGGSVRRLQRLTITQHKLEKGTCGQRNVQWVFSLDNAAPEDGYIVQHIRSMDFTATCPNIAMGPAAMDKEFWEAWLVKKGDKVDWTTTRDSWTDGSTRPARPGTNGRQSSLGTLKFFKKSTTGDLGDFGVAPASSSSAWGPGKVSTSGALPSTPTKPSWWDGTPVEGPVDREATSVWNCCDSDASKHTSTVTAKP